MADENVTEPKNTTENAGQTTKTACNRKPR